MKFGTWHLDPVEQGALVPERVVALLAEHRVKSVQFTGRDVASTAGVPELLRRCSAAGIVAEVVLDGEAPLGHAVVDALDETFAVATVRVTDVPRCRSEFVPRWLRAIERVRALRRRGVAGGLSVVVAEDQAAEIVRLVRDAHDVGSRGLTLLGMPDVHAVGRRSGVLVGPAGMEALCRTVGQLLQEDVVVDRSCWWLRDSEYFLSDGRDVPCSEVVRSDGSAGLPTRPPGPGDVCRYAMAVTTWVTAVWPERACWAVDEGA